MQYTYLRRFFSTAQNSVWTPWFWCLLVLLSFFCFPSSTLVKHLPLRAFFVRGNKTSLPSQIRWIGRVGHGGHDLLVKNCWVFSSVDRWAGKSPVMKWANTLKESSKKLPEAEHSLSQQRQLVNWYWQLSRTFISCWKPVLEGARPPEDNNNSGLGRSSIIFIYIYKTLHQFREANSYKLHETFK